MTSAQTVTREDATTWAGWFKALGDPTRILILHLLATEARAMTTGEVVAAMDVGQSTVSHHLQILGETCFVHVERSGTQSWWRINERCMASFPSAAELIMGRLPLVAPVGRLLGRLRPRDLLMAIPEPDLARYADAARRVDAGDSCATPDGPFGASKYDDLAGIPEAAVRVSLGCGNPISVADLRPGDVVLDLGAGGGIDVLLSARRVGPTGFAYGLDATPEMLDLARRNAADAGATNVEFLHGSIEAIPLPDASVDVVVSNCVIVLSGDKDATFAEIARVLRPGGRVGISDIVRAEPDDGTPTTVSCADSAITVDAYEAALRQAGLGRVAIELTDPIGAGLSNAIIRSRKPAVSIRPMTAADWPAVRDIYAAGIATGNATFETGPPSWEHWDAGHLDDQRLVATTADDTVIGWAALSPVSDRCVYAGVAENSLYIHPEHRGSGIGTTLLDALVTGAEHAGFWTVQTGIFPENTASIAAHQAVGFRIVGRRERIGQLNGVWRDTLVLERRSQRI